MALVKAVRSDSVLDWTHNWSNWLVEGDSISSHQWTITPTGPTLANAAAATVSAGPNFVSGLVYRLQEKITTAQGRTGVREIVLKVVD